MVRLKELTPSTGPAAAKRQPVKIQRLVDDDEKETSLRGQGKKMVRPAANRSRNIHKVENQAVRVRAKQNVRSAATGPRNIPKVEVQAVLHIKDESLSKLPMIRARSNGHGLPSVYHPTGTADGRLQHAFMQAVNDLKLQASWVVFALPRIGSDPVIDQCAAAVVQAHVHATHSPTSKPKPDANTSYYVQAIASLRKNLVPSDSTLVAVALLALYEMVLRGADHNACTQHWMGVAAIALAKGKASGTENWSEAARAILTEYWVCLGSRTACAIGIPSPFDSAADGWLDLDPIFGGPDNDVPYDTVKLRKHSHGHYIRFPRLLAMLRALRQHRDPKTYPAVTETVELARQLLHNGNHAAESKMLHRVNVTRTLDPQDREVTLYSYDFRSEGEVSSCVLYWQSRLSTIKCCLMINEILDRSPPPFDTEDLEKEQARIATNIIMSWQDGFKRDIFGRYMSQAMFVTHLALKNFTTFRGQPTAHTRDWILKCFHKAAEADWPGLEPTTEEMDETTDWLAGGISTGFFGGYAVKSPTPEQLDDAGST